MRFRFVTQDEIFDSWRESILLGGMAIFVLTVLLLPARNEARLFAVTPDGVTVPTQSILRSIDKYEVDARREGYPSVVIWWRPNPNVSTMHDVETVYLERSRVHVRADLDQPRLAVDRVHTADQWTAAWLAVEIPPDAVAESVTDSQTTDVLKTVPLESYLRHYQAVNRLLLGALISGLLMMVGACLSYSLNRRRRFWPR